jgi:hypothetical protein
MLQNRQMFHTADLVGGIPLRLIGVATNEWQILQGAAPHARHYTRFWFRSSSFGISTKPLILPGEAPFA